MKNKIFKTLLISLISICACLSFAMVAGCGEDKGTVSEAERFIVGDWVAEQDSKAVWKFNNDNTAQLLAYNDNGFIIYYYSKKTWSYNEETTTISLADYERPDMHHLEDLVIKTADNKYYFEDGSYQYYKS